MWRRWRRRRRQLIATADLGRGLGVRVLPVQHFTVQLGRAGLSEPGYFGRDCGRRRRRRRVFRRRRVMMERIAPPADGGRRPRTAVRGRVPAGRLRLSGAMAAFHVPAGTGRVGAVGLSGARLQHCRDAAARVRLSGARYQGRRCHRGGGVGRLDRAPDVLDRRLGGHGRVVRSRFGRHAHRERPHRGRSHRLRADVRRGRRRCRGDRDCGRGGRRGRLSVRRHRGRLDADGRLRARRHRRRYVTGLFFVRHC